MFALTFKIMCLVVFTVTIGTVESSNFERVDQFIRYFQTKTGTPGMAAAIVENGNPVFARTYGLKDINDKKSRVTPNTLFQIASCSKAFTSYLIAQLVREGLVAYDDPVTKHIPEFRLSDPDITKNIHVKDLLCMASGLPGHDSMWYHSNMTRHEVIFERLPHLQFNRGLREKYQYNSIVYTAAGVVAERVTHRLWEDEVHERIFKPLKMDRSLTSLAEAQRLPPNADMAKGYTTERNSSQIVFLPQEDASMIGPAGSIYSTLNDMIKWVRCQMSENIPKEMHVLKNPYLYEANLIFNNTIPNQLSVNIGYAYGWAITFHRGQYVITHSGQSDGYCTSVALFPEENRGYVTFGNMDTVCLIFAKFLFRMDDIVANRTFIGSDEEWLSGLLPSLAETEVTPSDRQVERPEQYVGRYWNPGYAYMEVSVGQSGLSILYNNIDYLLKPEKNEDFFILVPQTPARTDGGHETECSFVRDSSNEVVACLINFEPNVSPIDFTKLFQGEYDLKYLGSFVGVFESGTISVTISLNRGKRLLVATGVPSYDPDKLNPVKRNSFFLNRSTYLFEFVFTNGTVSTLNISQGTDLLYVLNKTAMNKSKCGCAEY